MTFAATDLCWFWGPGLASRPVPRFLAFMSDATDQREARFAADIEAIATAQSLAAFRRLFDHYAPRVKSYLRRLGAADEAADDLVQEVMLTVWRRAAQFDPGKATVSTWIYTITRNRRIDAMRRDRRPLPDLVDPSMEPDGPVPADRVVELRELSGRLELAVATLPPEQSRLLRIFYFEEKTHNAIAAELGLPLGTVKSRLRLALGKLRGLLGEAS